VLEQRDARARKTALRGGHFREGSLVDEHEAQCTPDELPSTEDALRVWSDLEDARRGQHGYGGDVAEIYFSNLAAAGALKLARMFEERRGVEVLVEQPDGWRRIGPWFVELRGTPLHRFHARVRAARKVAHPSIVSARELEPNFAVLAAEDAQDFPVVADQPKPSGYVVHDAKMHFVCWCGDRGVADRITRDLNAPKTP